MRARPPQKQAAARAGKRGSERGGRDRGRARILDTKEQASSLCTRPRRYNVTPLKYCFLFSSPSPLVLRVRYLHAFYISGGSNQRGRARAARALPALARRPRLPARPRPRVRLPLALWLWAKVSSFLSGLFSYSPDDDDDLEKPQCRSLGGKGPTQ